MTGRGRPIAALVGAALVVAAGLVVAAAPSGAADFDAGMRAANLRNFAEAIRQWRPLAEAGEARAQYHLGMLSELGQGAARDYSAAAAWYARAAAQGHAAAQNALAILYAEGLGVERDPAEAYKWFALAAHGGNGFAEANLRRLRGMLSAEARAEAVGRLRAHLENNP